MRVILTVVIVLICKPLFANEFREVGLPMVTNFTEDDYFAHHTNWDISQADNGLVYIANGNGLLEYDGVKFYLYESPNKTTIRDIEIVDDKIYAGTINTLGYYQKNKKGIMEYHSLTHFIDEQYLPIGDIYSINEFEGKVVFKAVGHFFIWDGESIKTFVDKSNSRVKAVKNEEHLYTKLYSDKAVYSVDLTSENILKATSWELPEKAQIKNIFTMEDGSKVFFTAHFGIYQQKGNELVHLKDSLTGQTFIYDVIKTDDGNYYVATINSGLFVLSNDFKILRNYQDIHGINNSQIMSLMKDRQNNIWMAGNKSIGFMRPPNEVSRYAQDKNIYAFNFSNIHGVPSFVGRKIQQLQDSKTNPLYPPSFSAFGDVEGVSETMDYGDQTFLVTNNGLYLAKIKDGKMLEHELIFDKTKFVFDIEATDDLKHIFFSTDLGVFRLIKQDNHWQAIPIKGLDFEVNKILVQGNDTLWIGSRTSELYRLEIPNINTDKQILDSFNEKDGLGSNVVNPFKLDSGMVFGTNDGTISYSLLDKSLHPTKGLPNIFSTKDQAVEILYQDEANRIWYSIGGQKGYVQKIGSQWKNHQNMFNYFPDRSIKGYISVNPDILWFMQTGGDIFRMDVNKVENIAKLAPLYIRQTQNAITEDVIQFGIVNTINEELNFDSNSIRVSFALVDFATPGKTLYRSKLIGSNNPQWSKWTHETYKDFIDLRGNDYVLEVQAKDGFGRITDSTSMAFKVLPPFYLSRSALIIYALLALATLIVTAWLVQRWRTKKLKAHNVELASLVNKKTIEIQGHIEELEQQQELKTRFFTNISHELRTPLSLIILPLQKLILSNQQQLNKESQDLLTLSLKNANGMKELVNQVLDVSRFEQKSMPILVQKNNLISFVKNIVQQFDEWADENKQQIKLVNQKDELTLYFDRQMMEKIISNLLSNAIKYSGNNSIITVSFKQNDSGVDVIIKDNGIGIVKDKCEQVFERYFKHEENKTDYDSSGIGLAFVREMVELHHGQISLKSDTGQGCEFTLTFQNGHKHFSSIEHRVQSEAAFDDNQSHVEDTATIMLVEDNTDLREFVSKYLSLEYHVIQAINGVDALQTLTHELPDLIISDIMMPQMDGIEFLQKLREQAKFKTVPFFLLSSKSTPSDTQMGLQYGADDYLVKPFEMDELLLRVKNMINSRKLIRTQVKQHLSEIKHKNKAKIGSYEKKIRNVILDNLHDSGFNVNSMAEELGMERSALFRKVKKELNISPSKYIQQIRLEIAKELLINDSLSVSEVAYSSGFESLSYFSKQFKIKYGYSPSSQG